MNADLSPAELQALQMLARHGAARLSAHSEHLMAYEGLVRRELAHADAFDESARLYGLTDLGKETMRDR